MLGQQETQKIDDFFLSEDKTKLILYDSAAIQDSHERQVCIMNLLLFDHIPIDVDYLSETLRVSRSTISNDLIEIKKLLRPFQLGLQSKKNKGITLLGSELCIREFIMNYFFMDRLQDEFLPFSMNEDSLEEISLEDIAGIVVEVCQQLRLKCTDFMIYNLVFHISIAIKRNQQGFLLEPSSSLYSAERTLEFRAALKILARIETTMGLHFSSEETRFMASHLKNAAEAKVIFPKADNVEWKIRTQLLEVLTEIERTTDYALADDPILIDGLMLH